MVKANPDNRKIIKNKCGKRKVFPSIGICEGKLQFQAKISYSYIILKKRINLTKGQVRKSVGRMTWHQEPKKDVTSCDKPGLGANIHRPRDFRMGKPT